MLLRNEVEIIAQTEFLTRKVCRYLAAAHTRAKLVHQMNAEQNRQTQFATTTAGQAGRGGNGRTALWVMASITLGFFLPVCACAMLLIAGAGSLSLMSPGALRISSGTGDAVAIVRVEGTITTGDAANNSSTVSGAVSGVVIDDLRRANEDDAVKAIVLRVNSPGGAVTGSAEIHDFMRELDKPIVASLSELAASGGYYISAPTDYIIARPDTLTGSIGVIIQLVNAAELIEELGVSVNLITSADNKALGSLWQTLTPEQAAIFQGLVDESFNEFVQVVATGRNMTRDEALALADGRIYSGRQALDNGLVDALGNLQDAIDKAAELGGISGAPRIVEYERTPSFSQLLFGFSSRLLQSEPERIRESLNALTTPVLEYRYVAP